MGPSSKVDSTRPAKAKGRSGHKPATSERPRSPAAIESGIADVRQRIAAGLSNCDAGETLPPLDLLEKERDRHPQSIVTACERLPPGEEPFRFNNEAREAARRALDAQRAADLCQFIDRDSIGAAGTTEKLLQIVDLLKQVAAIAKSIDDSPEERRRFEQWEEIYDNPRRPETFGKGP